MIDVAFLDTATRRHEWRVRQLFTLQDGKLCLSADRDDGVKGLQVTALFARITDEYKKLNGTYVAVDDTPHVKGIVLTSPFDDPPELPKPVRTRVEVEAWREEDNSYECLACQ